MVRYVTQFSGTLGYAATMRMTMAHPLSDRFEIVGSPLKLSDTPPVYEHPPPLLGEHTEQVLRDLLHYSDDHIQALRQEHAI